MENQFVSYEKAIELKELGFDELCWAWYNMPDEDVRYCFSEQRSPITNSHEEWSAQIWKSKVENIGLPTSSQVFKWFREKYDYYCEIFVDDNKTFGFLISYFVEDGRADKPIQRGYNSYEEAEDACINKLIEVIKEK
jgi:hypothetical protein